MAQVHRCGGHEVHAIGHVFIYAGGRFLRTAGIDRVKLVRGVSTYQVRRYRLRNERELLRDPDYVESITALLEVPDLAVRAGWLPLPIQVQCGECSWHGQLG